MWILKSCADPDQVIYLLPGKEYVVGKKKECGIAIENDSSISRKHAIIRVGKTEHRTVSISIEDCSKYGTSVNNEKISSQTLLSDGDLIAFGILGNKFRVCSYHVVITTSSITSAAEKKGIQDVAALLGGHCIPEWHDSCTHLVMEKFLMTIKGVCALASAKPIIKPNYLWRWRQSLEQKTPPPDIDSHLPPIEESCLKNKNINLNVSEKRKSLFRNKKFLFVSAKQYTSLELPIRLAGGESELILKAESKQVLSPDILVVTYPSTSTQSKESALASELAAILKQHSKRTIHESEIGFAVVFNSTTKYCNPDFHFELNGEDGSNQVTTESQPDFTSSRIIVSETQNTMGTQVFENTQMNTSVELFDIKEVPETSSAKENSETELMDVNFLDEPRVNKKRPPVSNVDAPQGKQPRLELEVDAPQRKQRRRQLEVDAPQRKQPKIQLEVNNVPTSCGENFVQPKSPDLFEKSTKDASTADKTANLVSKDEQEQPRPETNHVWLCAKKCNEDKDSGDSEIKLVIEFRSMFRTKAYEPRNTSSVDEDGPNFKRFKKQHTLEREKVRLFVHDDSSTDAQNMTIEDAWAKADARLQEESDDDNPFK